MAHLFPEQRSSNAGRMRSGDEWAGGCMSTAPMFRLGTQVLSTQSIIADVLYSAANGINAPYGQFEAERARVDKLCEIVALLVAALPPDVQRHVVHSVSWQAEEA